MTPPLVPYITPECMRAKIVHLQRAHVIQRASRALGGCVTCVGCEARAPVCSAVVADEDIGLIHLHAFGIVEPAEAPSTQTHCSAQKMQRALHEAWISNTTVDVPAMCSAGGFAHSLGRFEGIPCTFQGAGF